MQAHPGPVHGGLQGLLPGVDLGVQAAPEQRVAGVDEQLLAGLGVLDEDQPEVGQVELERVDDPDGDHLVPVGQPGQRPLPARRR